MFLPVVSDMCAVGISFMVFVLFRTTEAKMADNAATFGLR